MKKFIIILLALFGGFYMATISEIIFLCKSIKKVEIISNPFNINLTYKVTKQVGASNDEHIYYYIYLNNCVCYLSHINSYKRYIRFNNYDTKPKLMIIVDNKAIIV